jgi:hypothetical protein
MHLRPSRQWSGLVLLGAALAGCQGRAVVHTPGPTGPAVKPDCDVAAFASASPADAAAAFAADVYPHLTDGKQGCVACHAAGSGRSFLVTTDPGETFYKARSAGLLGPTGGVLDRLTSAKASTRMPQGGDPWSKDWVDALARVTCMLQVAQSADGGGLPDEEFPPELLLPYVGDGGFDPDNTFLGYQQLRGKVQAIFSSGWTDGDGGDAFAANIGPFGGVDFSTHFVEARTATSDFLLSLDSLGKAVCAQAVAQQSGPFAGTDPTADTEDTPPSSTATLQAEDPTQLFSAVGQKEGTTWDLYANGTLATTQPFVFPAAGQYRLTVRARGTPSAGLGPDFDLRVGSDIVNTVTDLPTTMADYPFTLTLPKETALVGIQFTNDAQVVGVDDRNLVVDSLTIEGPLGTGTGTARETAARAAVDGLYRKILYRPASPTEQADGLALVRDLETLSGRPSAWAGLCEALVHAPEFLFTLSPAQATATDAAVQARLLLNKVALDLLARPATDAEAQQLTSGAKTLDQLVDTYLQSPEFRAYFYYKMRIRTESDGTDDADEPARLWTHLMLTGKPLRLLLTGDFGMDAQLNEVPRDPVHGKTGLLTMKGFILHKPGFPRFNYAARVLEDFLGYTFEIPPEVIAARLNATAASTVDPTSICFACHKLLTPLAHQRLAWDDNGQHRTLSDGNQPIDDTDFNLVADYPYKGKGMEAFSTQAVKKERFIRHTLDAEFLMLLNRPMRHDQDERVVYKQLWDLVQATDGDLRAPLKAIIQSPHYQGK